MEQAGQCFRKRTLGGEVGVGVGPFWDEAAFSLGLEGWVRGQVFQGRKHKLGLGEEFGENCRPPPLWGAEGSPGKAD